MGVPKVKPVDPPFQEDIFHVSCIKKKQKDFFVKVVPVIGFDIPTPKLKPGVVVVARENPAVAGVDTFAGSKASPEAVAIGVILFVKFVKLGRLDAIDIDVVVAVMLPPRPNVPVPATMVVGVPNVKPVSPVKDMLYHYIKI